MKPVHLRSALHSPSSQLLSLARSPIRVPRRCFVEKWLQSRNFVTTLPHANDTVPLRKHLKEEAKRKKAEGRSTTARRDENVALDPKLGKWELTVGIEVHARLNTAHKLFSDASVTTSDNNGQANSHVALFDAALPGTQPHFQQATLLPALRAAIALGCEVQTRSSWDRKHYFHWDQPNGYQITQYYGRLSLPAYVVRAAN